MAELEAALFKLLAGGKNITILIRKFSLPANI
jgi:hypothetical protein